MKVNNREKNEICESVLALTFFLFVINDVPLTALCRTIEIDLLQMMGETDVPPPIKPENDILM
jgi:predicted membrane chloride channel (bestrophin family)